jgi:4-amino-4-deoxy-L-arabinose transferase-like glycosyltransferase
MGGLAVARWYDAERSVRGVQPTAGDEDVQVSRSGARTPPTTKPCGTSWRLEQREMTLLAALLGIGLVPRVALQLGATAFISGDSGGYVDPALDLLNGYGLTDWFKRPPGYPLLVAATLGLSGQRLEAVTALQHLLGLATVVLTFLLGRRLGGAAVGGGAGLLVALSGPQLTFEHLLQAEALFTFLVVLSGLLLVALLERPSARLAFATGLAIGLTSLVKPVGQALLVVALAAALAALGGIRARLARAALLLVGFGLVISPWLVRNQLTHGRAAVGGTLGQSLAAFTQRHSRGVFVFDGPGLAPDPDPARQRARELLQTGIEKGTTPPMVAFDLRREFGLGEVEADEVLKQVALETIRRQPLEYLGRLPVFVGMMLTRDISPFDEFWDSARGWLADPVHRELVPRTTPNQAAGRPLLEALVNLYRPVRLGLAPALLALLAMALAWTTPRRWPVLAIGAVAFELLLLQAALDGPPARYRYPVEPLIGTLAVLALGELARRAARLTGRVWKVGARSAAPRAAERSEA